MQSRMRSTYAATDPTQNTKKSELQRRMDAMTSSCNGMALKSKCRGKIQSFSRPEPVRSNVPVVASQQRSSGTSLPVDSTTRITRKPPPAIDPLQNCYGRPAPRPITNISAGSVGISINEDLPKGILSKPSTPKSTTQKKVSFNLGATGMEPSAGIADSVTFPTSGKSGSFPDVKGKVKGNRPPLFQPPSAKPTRPSLSEQLSAIANKAGDITADIRSKAGLPNPDDQSGSEVPIYSSPVKNFTVGTLQCRYSASAVFYRNRLEYLFHHPFESSEILLVLYYKDMQSLALSPNPQPGKMYFRVPRRLVHFAADYDPIKHFVVLYFSSSLSLQTVRSEVVPLISGMSSIASASGSGQWDTPLGSESGSQASTVINGNTRNATTSQISRNTPAIGKNSSIR